MLVAALTAIPPSWKLLKWPPQVNGSTNWVGGTNYDTPNMENFKIVMLTKPKKPDSKGGKKIYIYNAITQGNFQGMETIVVLCCHFQQRGVCTHVRKKQTHQAVPFKQCSSLNSN